MKAMIFAAGLGRRLGKITEERPKALLEINGKSVLRLAVEKVAAFGFDDIIINVHHHAGLVEKEIERLNRNGLKISVSDERDLLLETGGGLFKAKWFFDDKPFLLYNSDVISDIDLHALLSYHFEKRGIATIAAARRNENRVFLADNTGIICGWRNRSAGEEIISRESDEPLAEISFSGIHIVNPMIFRYMESGIYSMTSLYLQIASTQNIYAYMHDPDFWIDIGTPEKLDEARKALSNRT
jgi:NDP-sugar pyrophosphorylase family protein